jgi:hypothetical protein
MRKLLLSVLAGLALSQAPSAFACGDAVPVTTAKEAGAFQPSVSVEMKGTLQVRWIYRCGKPTACVTVNGTTYELTFPAEAEEAQAKKLDGQAVLVKGTLAGRSVTVSSLEALPFDSFGLTRLVKIKGKLESHSEPILDPYWGIERLHGFRTVWEIVVDGQRYELNFGSNEQFLKMAETFRGKTVVITGKYEEGIPQDVLELTHAKAELIARPLPYYVAAITVTSMGVEPGDKAYYQETRNVDVIGTVEVPAAVIEEGVPAGCYALVHVNGQTYWLDLGKRTDVQEKVNQLKDHKARIKGHLEPRMILFPSGTVDVLVVDEIEAAAP